LLSLTVAGEASLMMWLTYLQVCFFTFCREWLLGEQEYHKWENRKPSPSHTKLLYLLLDPWHIFCCDGKGLQPRRHVLA